jgi:N-acetylmuramoyl-L-alanine amidase
LEAYVEPVPRREPEALIEIGFIDASNESWLLANPPWFRRDQQPAERALCAAVWIL